ncbi:MAG: VOC family protein [Actinomycetota bacterium]|nr:VOC family protein [Actinomycetota bacterium]
MTSAAIPLFEQPWPEGEYRFFQLGFVVQDLLTAAQRWARVFGVGPFHAMPTFEWHMVVRGEPATVTAQVAVAQAGPVQVELIHQQCDRPSIFRDWSRDGACAIHQIATVTSDFDAKMARYRELGYTVAAESVGGRFRVAYVDTVSDFGFYTEVVESSPGFLPNLGTIAQACAAWDGSDPLLLLGRRGRAE